MLASVQAHAPLQSFSEGGLLRRMPCGDGRLTNSLPTSSVFKDEFAESVQKARAAWLTSFVQWWARKTYTSRAIWWSYFHLSFGASVAMLASDQEHAPWQPFSEEALAYLFEYLSRPSSSVRDGCVRDVEKRVALVVALCTDRLLRS